MPLTFSNDNMEVSKTLRVPILRRILGCQEGWKRGNIRRKRCRLSVYNVKWRRGSVVFVIMMSSMRGAAEYPPNGNIIAQLSKKSFSNRSIHYNACFLFTDGVLWQDLTAGSPSVHFKPRPWQRGWKCSIVTFFSG